MARSRKSLLFKETLDFCKFRPERIRDLTTAQLERIRPVVGRLVELPKREGERKTPRYLMARFVSAVASAKTLAREAAAERHAAEVARRRGDDQAAKQADKYSADSARWSKWAANEAARYERLIWDRQQKLGCKIVDSEIVARDAAREGQPQELVDKIRGRRKAKIR